MYPQNGRRKAIAMKIHVSPMATDDACCQLTNLIDRFFSAVLRQIQIRNIFDICYLTVVGYAPKANNFNTRNYPDD